MNTHKGFLGLLSCILAIKLVAGVQQCCGPNVTLENTKRCKNSQNLTIACDSYLITLSNDWSISNHFILSNDSEGTYLDAYVLGYTIKEPNFCIGNLSSWYTNETFEVALVCANFRNWYREADEGGPRYNNEALNIFIIILQIVNLFSFLFLFLCAFIYGVLPPLRDTQGQCYFYFTLNAALGHMILSYLFYFNTDAILPDLCITNLYLLMFLFLSCFSWATVLSFNTWRQTKSTRITDESGLLDKYMCVGYGLPAVLLFLGFTHVHLAGVSEMFFELDCYEHQRIIVFLYVILPILFSQIVNLIFFIDCQRLLWNSHALQQDSSKRNLKILRYRCLMNAKLFFIMGLPWLMGIVISLLLNYAYHVFLYLLMFFVAIIVAGEGIFIFVILVASRKRVLRVIANKWFVNLNIFPSKWKTMNDSETEHETENGENRGNEDFSVHYNVPAVKDGAAENGNVENMNKEIVTTVREEV